MKYEFTEKELKQFVASLVGADNINYFQPYEVYVSRHDGQEYSVDLLQYIKD